MRSICLQEKAERESDLGSVAKLKYGDLKEQEKLLKDAEVKVKCTS